MTNISNNIELRTTLSRSLGCQ